MSKFDRSQFPDRFDFVAEEHLVLSLWDRLDAFRTSLELTKNRRKFTFYDGPPFATGLPHYGHFLAGTVKDVVTRWMIMNNGLSVERRFGWDCHGLPIEYEIDKLLGIRTPDDVKALGIAEYNRQCRSIAMKYAHEWESQVRRMGRWIDFQNDYKTLYPEFMESVWWVFKQLFEKGLVYRGIKVMPYSTACATPLSNFEANQNYKETVDPSIFVLFPLIREKNVSFVAWTTTPWTLPSNRALCLNPKSVYVTVERANDSRQYMLMKSRISFVFDEEEQIHIIKEHKGSDLYQHFSNCHS